MWKNTSHPNVLNLIGTPSTLDDEGYSLVSDFMVNDKIMEYVRGNAGSHLKLVSFNCTPLCCLSLSTFQIVDLLERLKDFHHVNIVHGDLKGVSLSAIVPQLPLTWFFRQIF